MKQRSTITITVLLVMLLSGCGLQMEKYQGETSRDDIENMGMNDKVTNETQNPRLMSEPGDTWGLKQDRKLIKEAVNQIPGAETKRVILEANRVWVSVKVDGADDLSKEEMDDWKEEVKQVVFRAVPRYDVSVKVS
ncbi:hypothetical protein H0266_10155 [Halobacillus locisalis]|uniref:Sporulation lipoprotein YhcN/YlaJ (Spore_YhcN_YlaJ) n=1 Tax=Halobacillus locisalis TaxID=220753 RepID=A0A838CT63_9BACI|nr:hypothetical protein [Halobacillus locisalis]MBA2175257.1 hypothetical protein [Halobacillus locisalis]